MLPCRSEADGSRSERAGVSPGGRRDSARPAQMRLGGWRLAVRGPARRGNPSSAGLRGAPAAPPLGRRLSGASKDVFEIVGDFARLDHNRYERTGFPEVVFGEGKSARQVKEIASRMAATVDDYPAVVVSRSNDEQVEALRGVLPDLHYEEAARMVVYPKAALEREPTLGSLGIVVAGTADSQVATEATTIARVCGAEVRSFYDVGVAGLQRLLVALPEIRKCDVGICVAGMEGALPRVLAGLLEAPVIAVPTSIGYGASQGGLTPLHAMLSGCAPGVSVVNIDNGFGAAAAAVKVRRLAKRSAAGAEARGDD